jgi:hypothetical protein
MFNRWSRDEAVKIFGKDLGNHIFEKWITYGLDYFHDRTMQLYSNLDSECRVKLVERACELYPYE